MYNAELGCFRPAIYGSNRAHSPNRGAAFEVVEDQTAAEKLAKIKQSITAELMYKRGLQKAGVVVPAELMAAWEEVRNDSFAARDEIDVLEAVPDQPSVSEINISEVVHAAEMIVATNAERELVGSASV
ncbi:MAG TPA: hypothetical protein VHB51_01670 [Candidatus Saccharimonadales bacterium]|nr:hypothetical protein [Candidatus Saccharimonadales bacterium]